MPFIGNQLSTSFQNVETQTITGDGSTAYTLNNAVADGKDLLVYINNVKQEEGSGKSYTATGTTITFTEAVASTDSCYVVFIGQAIGTVTPKDGSIVSSMLADANLEMPNTLDLNGKELILDADADTSITADTDDTIDIKIAGSDVYQITATKVDLNGKELVLDADADTSITADTDDQIDFKTGGSDRLIIDGNGDLGVGVSPESDHYSASLNINFGLTGLLGSASSGTNATFLTNNAYLNTSANWIYKEADEATKYNQVSGAHIWEYAGSGSAGATISFSEDESSLFPPSIILLNFSVLTKGLDEFVSTFSESLFIILLYVSIYTVCKYICILGSSMVYYIIVFFYNVFIILDYFSE